MDIETGLGLIGVAVLATTVLWRATTRSNSRPKMPLTQTLYKYRSLRTADRAPHPFTESVFRTRQLWFAEPASFNDPFDCNLPTTLNGSDEEVLEFLRKYMASAPSELTANLSLQTVPKYRECFVEGHTQHREAIYTKSSVFCWAGRGDSIPMFAYYADGHRGIALEFEIEVNHPLGQADAVHYQPKFPPLNYLELLADGKITQSLIFTKAECWRHEEELRVFRQYEPPGNVAFEPSHLRRVIFGAKSLDEDVQLVRGWLTGWPSSVVFAKAIPATDSFSLCVRDFEVVTS